VPAEPDGAHRVRITATMDRRDAEAVALALRRRLKQLGLEDATITIEPSRKDPAPPAGPSA
jgi:hypothetical protein